ncbi:hypothetical protein EJ04DRAFT_523578 [Polyplosphaeria fusca]|uniref:Uncharacterized protein n=1 Tax=Polyplosphaeria fusca TaxID=682080 RepID=A0A9P4R0K0_9PLEO|nr:hypothetical protein EJ04DRAFT_523578 [Polyplosphaeria fusca]
MPPKRALFSVNINSNAESLYQRIEDHNKEGKARVRTVEHDEPVVGNTSLQVLTRPFEKEVQQTVERIVDDKHITASSSTSSPAQPRRSKKKLEAEYDTSDL